MNLEKSKLVERQGRKATGLRPSGYDGRVAKSRDVGKPALALDEAGFWFFQQDSRAESPLRQWQTR
jgi:hypothetical protein